MTKGKARRVTRNVLRKPVPKNPTQHRNRINQAAAKYRIPEQRVHTALFMTSPQHTPVR